MVMRCDPRHAVRRAKGWRKLRFASREEVEELTGLAPGSIPPFGSLFGLPTLCDERLGENEVINFNAGDHSISVSMRYADYLRGREARAGDVRTVGDDCHDKQQRSCSAGGYHGPGPDDLRHVGLTATGDRAGRSRA